MLVVAAYRSDGLPRDHMLALAAQRAAPRRPARRAAARRRWTAETAAALIAAVLGERPSPALARALHDRTQGVPFFVEELARALRAAGAPAARPARARARRRRRGPGPGHGPRRRADGRLASSPTRRARRPRPPPSPARPSTSSSSGAWPPRTGSPSCCATASCARTATAAPRSATRSRARRFYADVPWLRRRALHRRLAEALEPGAEPGGRRPLARRARVGDRRARRWSGPRASPRPCYAYRDAAGAGRQALELWPGDDDAETRIEVLERYARCAELAGELAEAVRAWRELSECSADVGGRARARSGAWPASTSSRASGSPAFAARRAGRRGVRRRRPPRRRRRRAPGDGQPPPHGRRLRRGDRARRAWPPTRPRSPSARTCAPARSGLHGVSRAKRGEFDAGLETVRGGLALALEHDHTAVAAELYQRLGLVLYDSADYRRAEQALDSALTCAASTATRAPSWPASPAWSTSCASAASGRARIDLGRELLADGNDAVGDRRDPRRDRRLPGPARPRRGACSPPRSPPAARSATTTWRSTRPRRWRYVAAAEGAHDEAAEHCRALLARWDAQRGPPLLRSGACAGRPRTSPAAATAPAPTPAPRRSPGSPRPPATPTRTPRSPTRSARPRCSRATPTPPPTSCCARSSCTARSTSRSSAPRSSCAPASRWPRPASASRRWSASATPTAPRASSGARPLASRGGGARSPTWASRWAAGRRAPEAEGAGLTRRELDVVRRIAVGRTNRDVAQELFLSPRTVDMHVRNILRKLDCRSRVEAAYRAGELGLLG